MKNTNFILKNRQKKILQTLIESYIERGEPIASNFLTTHYNFNVCSATIRNDFQELTAEGYLYKFHISGGRVPTDKAWNFFVSLILEDNDLVNEWRRKWENILRQKMRLLNNWEKIVNFLSEKSQALGFCYLKDTDEVKKSGLKYVFSHLINEPVPLEIIPKIAESLENFDYQLKRIKVLEQPMVFIGRDNPFIDSGEFSVVLVQTRRSENILGILGHKRMPYDKNIGLLIALAENQ